MRIALSIIFVVIILALGVCVFFAMRSRKPIGKAVAQLVAALIPPVAGNLLIIASIYETLSIVGCYIYFIGMDVVMFALIQFTKAYCGIEKPRLSLILRVIFYSALALDTIQLLVNIFTHHAFGMESITAYGSTYYRFIPYVGQYIHRVVDYVILGVVVIVFIIKLIKSPKVYSEKYLVILLSMLAVAVWQTFYIFSRTPVDISMIGFGVFGVLVFVLSLYYRPLRLLDRMLAAIASKMPEAILFFDTAGRCIWVNNKAIELLNIDVNQLEDASELLRKKIGEYEFKGFDWSDTFVKGDGEEMVSFFVERHPIVDDHQRAVGSYMTVRDDSNVQKTIQRETFNATHDSLTKVLNRAGYESIINNVDISKSFLVLIDIDSFKEMNDLHGHTIGDKVLVKIVEIIKKHFGQEECLARIGGDEFAVVITNANEKTAEDVKNRIDSINKELATTYDGLPTTSISAGGAYGRDKENVLEFFNDVDHALYETKFNGKRGFTLFVKR